MQQNLTSLFPQLDLLNIIASLSSPRINFSKTLIVGVQHLNETTGSLIEKFIEMGAEASNIFLAGKCYSSNPNSIHKLKILGCTTFTTSTDIEPGSFIHENNNVLQAMIDAATDRLERIRIERILIIDDGGRLIGKLPDLFSEYDTVCIEQTTKGIRDINVIHSKFPVISVAGSSFKTKFESHFIAEAVVANTQNYFEGLEKEPLVIGTGNIGNALVKSLRERGFSPKIIDKSTDSQEQMYVQIYNSDLVYGCTGNQVSIPKSVLSKNKIFASCSSEDIEFKDLLTPDFKFLKLPNHKCAPHLKHISKEYEFIVLNSGFPVNFDKTVEIEGTRNIQLTRTLIFIAVIQSHESMKLHSGLNPLTERFDERLEEFLSMKTVRESQAI